MSLFGSGTTFEESYPNVETINLTVKENGYMLHAHEKRSYSMDITDIRPNFPCHNYGCKGGGVDIEHRLRDKLLIPKESSYNGAITCRGKTSNGMQECMNSFEIDATATYKETAEAAE